MRVCMLFVLMKGYGSVCLLVFDGVGAGLLCVLLTLGEYDGMNGFACAEKCMMLFVCLLSCEAICGCEFLDVFVEICVVVFVV